MKAPTAVEVERARDAEESFLADLDVACTDLRSRACNAYEREAVWIDQVRAVVEAALSYPRLDPEHARILYVEAVRSGARARARLDLDIDLLVDLIDRGRRQLDDRDSLTRATAEGLGGAVYELISMCLIRGGEADLPGLLPQLMFVIVRPYLGLEAALAEFHRAD